MPIFHGPTTNTNQTGTNTSSNTNTSLTQGMTQGTNTQQGQQTGQQTSQFSNTTTPNLPGWYTSFLSSLPSQYASLTSALTHNANTPLYGPAQQAAFQNNLNQQKGAAQQSINSQLASQGALNSGRAAQVDTSLALGNNQQLNNYLAQVPQLNAQNQSQNLSQLAQALSGQAGFTSPISAFGTTQSGTSDSLNQLLTSLLNTSASNSTQSGQSTGTSSGTTSASGSSSTTPNILGGALAGGLSSGLGLLGQLAGKI